jgi:hypothetical protein
MLQNAENILQIPRKLCCCFSVFWPSGFTSFLSSWLCKALLCPLHGFICAHLFTATKATSVRKSQTRPTPEQRPAIKEATITNYNCSYKFKSYSYHNSYNCNRNNKTHKNPELTDDNQQPTTNNNLQIACQMEDSSSHIYANIMQDPAGKQMEGSSFQMLQLVSQMEGSSCKMLQVACEKESSNYKMLQVVCKWKVLALCKMKSSSSKMLQMIANGTQKWKVPAPKCCK